MEMKMDDAKYIDLIAKYLSGNIEPSEKAQMMAWVQATSDNRSFFEKMIQLWSIAAPQEEKFETDTPKAWDTLEARLFGGGGVTLSEELSSDKKPSAKIARLSINKVILRVAAVILLAISVGIWWYGGFSFGKAQTVVIQTAAKEQQTVKLPDGSMIWLNENTRLSYKKDFTQRAVQLEGEAFFDVTHMEDQKFTIQSGGASTTVLGTSFNVRAYPTENRVEVTVETGRVELRKANDVAKKVVLMPGKSGVFDKKSEEVRVVATEIPNADAWKTQRLEFNDTPMREVVADLERYFDIKIEVANDKILNCPLTGNYPNPDLQEMFKRISFALDLQVEQQDSFTYRIQGVGCK